MVGQKELSAYASLKAEADKIEGQINALRSRLIGAYRSGEEVEDGRLILKVTINDEAERTAWKPVVERIGEAHPELRGAITQIVKANTITAPYERVEVKPKK